MPRFVGLALLINARLEAPRKKGIHAGLGNAALKP
jgi:hypothetical protein